MKILAALSMIAVACVFNTVPAAAQNAAFCLRGCDIGSNCSFNTLQQCQASASGRTAWCEANPFIHAANDVQQPGRVRYSRRKL